MKHILPVAIIVLIILLLVYSFIYPTPDDSDTGVLGNSDNQNDSDELQVNQESQTSRKRMPMRIRKIVDLGNDIIPVALVAIRSDLIYIADKSGLILKIFEGKIEIFYHIKFSKELYDIAYKDDMLYVYYAAIDEYRLSKLYTSNEPTQSGIQEEILLRIPYTGRIYPGQILIKDYILYLVTGSLDRAAGLDLTTLQGKLLKLDISVKKGYRIPTGNPYFNRPDAKSEIYITDFRHPTSMILYEDKLYITENDAVSNKVIAIDLDTKNIERIFSYKNSTIIIGGCFIPILGYVFADTINQIPSHSSVIRLENRSLPTGDNQEQYVSAETINVPYRILKISIIDEDPIPIVVLLIPGAVYQLLF